ncbi:MAG: dihydrofolate reductase family protein [Anaerolineales bacterium]|jgi:dihydrofolate reductase
MSKVVVFMNLTLDGVMQSPAKPDEDRRAGFKYGGWAAPYDGMTSAGASTPNFGALLLGRWTYEDLFAAWHGRTDDNPFTARLDSMQKYVASTTLKEPLAWINSTLLKGDVAEAVAGLKAKLGKDVDIVIMGSGELIQTLMQHNLVDRYVLLIHPVVLGSGRRLFTDGGAFAKLQLISVNQTPKGVVVASYEPAESMK